MSMMFKVIAFFFMFNIATGILTNVFGDDVTEQTGLRYDENFVDDLNGTFSGDVTSDASAQSELNFGEKILDFITLGLYTKVKNFIAQYLFGITTIFHRTGLLTTPLYVLLNVVITFIYAFGVFSLFTNKKPND